jgi:dephospho-CoA kinase
MEASAGQPLTAEPREKAIADARQRMAAQMSDAEKAPRCDYVIENNGTAAELETRVAAVYAELAAC